MLLGNKYIDFYFGGSTTMNVITFVEKLHNLDLQPVGQKLMSNEQGTGWTEEKTQVAIARYKMFLLLHFLFPHISLVPTQEIDEVWHTHILLNTRQYFQDCQHLFGDILHHYSPAEVDKAERQHQETAFSVTLNLFEEVFGVGVLGDTQAQTAACLSLPIAPHQPLINAACLTLPKQLPQLITTG